MSRETAQNFINRKKAEFKADLAKHSTRGFKDIGRKGKHFYLRVAWTFMQQSNLLEDKVFVVERLTKASTDGEISYKASWKKGDIEYRFGYYIVGQNGNKKDKWTWGQFCPLIPKEDLDKLLNQAKKDKEASVRIQVGMNDAVAACQMQTKVGEIAKSNLAFEQCKGQKLLILFSQNDYAYMDLVKVFIAERNDIAARLDKKKITREEAALEAAKAMSSWREKAEYRSVSGQSATLRSSSGNFRSHAPLSATPSSTLCDASVTPDANKLCR